MGCHVKAYQNVKALCSRDRQFTMFDTLYLIATVMYDNIGDILFGKFKK